MYVGPEIDDLEILSRVPREYRVLLDTANGYVAFHGGLHVRGACLAPLWHSLRAAWVGDDAIHTLFPTVDEDDVPFAEDALGDQFLLRGELVWKLRAESGELFPLDITLVEFDAAVRANPDEVLELGPLHQFRTEGGKLEADQLLGAYPPFVSKESARGVDLRAIPNLERRRFLSELAVQLGPLPDGAGVKFRIQP